MSTQYWDWGFHIKTMLILTQALAQFAAFVVEDISLCAFLVTLKWWALLTLAARAPVPPQLVPIHAVLVTEIHGGTVCGQEIRVGDGTVGHTFTGGVAMVI